MFIYILHNFVIVKLLFMLIVKIITLDEFLFSCGIKPKPYRALVILDWVISRDSHTE